MKKIKILSLAVLGFVGLAAACSSGSNTTTTPTNTTTNNQPTTTKTNTNTATNAAHAADDEIPASVKSAFAEAQSFTKQHKDIPQNTIAEIEKETGAKITEKDHHSYLAFATKDGKRTQIGAATIVSFKPKTSSGSADGEMVITYESKNGQPIIKDVQYLELSSSGYPIAIREFIQQFAGKGHDDKLEFGNTIMAKRIDEATAKAITSAIAVDVKIMQTLYGAAHSH